MPILHLAEMTWTEVRDLDRTRLVAILPTGAVEAHGPHLPLSTDPIIASAMAEAGACRLDAAGLLPLILPGLDYTAASFASGFPGTLSIRPETLTALLLDVAAALHGHGVRWLVIANAHFDPAHLGSLYTARKALAEAEGPRLIFPDVTRKPWALRLSDEFKSGACHAGRYEGSVVMARRPDLVREALQSQLSPNPRSLSVAIHDGLESFEEAGGPEAYFGDPAAATAEEGEATIRTLGDILAEAVLAEVDAVGLDA